MAVHVLEVFLIDLLAIASVSTWVTSIHTSSLDMLWHHLQYGSITHSEDKIQVVQVQRNTPCLCARCANIVRGEPCHLGLNDNSMLHRAIDVERQVWEIEVGHIISAAKLSCVTMSSPFLVTTTQLGLSDVRVFNPGAEPEITGVGQLGPRSAQWLRPCNY